MLSHHISGHLQSSVPRGKRKDLHAHCERKAHSMVK
jgi:hypothetical protein